MAKRVNPFVKRSATKLANKKKAGEKDAVAGKGEKKLPPWLKQDENGKVVAKGKGK